MHTNFTAEIRKSEDSLCNYIIGEGSRHQSLIYINDAEAYLALFKLHILHNEIKIVQIITAYNDFLQLKIEILESMNMVLGENSINPHFDYSGYDKRESAWNRLLGLIDNGITYCERILLKETNFPNLV